MLQSLSAVTLEPPKIQLSIVSTVSPSIWHEVMGLEQPHVQGVVAVRAQEGLEEPSLVEGQEGRRKEIPLIQGKEQRLWFLEQP